MSTFSCPRCGYEKTRYNDIVKHVNRKIMCKIVLKDVIPTIESIVKKIKKILCEHCNKEYSSLSSVKRHQNKSCKKLNNKKIASLEKEIELLKNSKNITINNNNLINIQININNFKNPTMSHISMEEIQKYLKDGDVFNKMFPRIYFDKNVPENHSIVYTNKRNGTLKMYQDDEYRTVKVEKAKENIDKTLRNMLDVLADDWEIKGIHLNECDLYADNCNIRARSEKIENEQKEQFLRDAHDLSYISKKTMKNIQSQKKIKLLNN